MAVLTRTPGRVALLVALSLGALAPAAALSAQAAPAERVARSVTRIFGAGALAEPMQIDSSAVFRVRTPAGVQGFAVVRNVWGKDQPITFLVAVDTADTLRDVDILVYRESYGGEVAYDAWRRQFRGKTATDSVALGRNIRSISGATISANSVTLGVRRALADLARWRAEGTLR